MINETLIYSDYAVRKKKESRIDKGKRIEVEIGFLCPNCKALINSLEHGLKIKCIKCGLKMVRFGNALECTKVK